MNSALDWLQPSLETLRQQGLLRQLRTRRGPQAATVEIDGQTYINFASNDYLGLANEARLLAAVKRSVQRSGWGGGASPLIVGHSDEHTKLEAALAHFEQTEAALLFPTGFAANSTVIPALVGTGDTIFSDASNHASIIDGCRLSGARIRVYRHADVNSLASLLHDAGPGRKLIVTDGLFSMDGDVAPLGPIADLATRHAAMLMVDEAHATGVLGASGRGAAEACGVEDRIDVKVGTLSKALGSMGGFVAGSRPLIDWIINRSRGYVFSTAAPAAACAAALEALNIVRDEPQRRVELRRAAADLRDGLRDAGYDLGASTTHIIPLVVGCPQRTMELSVALGQQGMLAPGIRPPSVAEGHSLVRISLSWPHTAEVRAQLVAACRQAAR